jgi:hypothetical protein
LNPGPAHFKPGYVPSLSRSDAVWCQQAHALSQQRGHHTPTTAVATGSPAASPILDESIIGFGKRHLPADHTRNANS